MTRWDRLHGRIALPDPSDPNNVKVDFSSFVRRLLLFETLLVHTHRLQEIPQMVDAWGWDAVIALLDSGAMQLVWDTRTQAAINYDSIVSRSRDRRDFPFTL